MYEFASSRRTLVGVKSGGGGCGSGGCGGGCGSGATMNVLLAQRYTRIVLFKTE